MPLDPTLPTTTTTATTTSAATSPLPQPRLHHHYPSPQSRQQLLLYPPTQQPLPIRSPNPHLAKHSHDPSNPFPFPFASPGRGGGPLKAVIPTAAYPPLPSLVYSHGVRAVASPHLDYVHPALHLTRPPPPDLQYSHLAHSPVTTSVKGGTVAAHPKATPRSGVSDIKNGYKDTSARERSRDDTFTVVRGRRVKITEDASLYALCRSWLRNGINEDIQPQQKDVMNALPKPLPASMEASNMPNKKDEKDEDEQEEDEKSVEHLSPQDLLKRHVKRAKRVRARSREERLQRIKRYRNRLTLLLPPPGEK